MRTANRLIVSGIAAVGIYAGLKEVDRIGIKDGQQVAACQQYLAAEAVKTTVLEPDCEPFAEFFERETTQLYKYDPDTQKHTQQSATVTYTLPDSATFAKRVDEIQDRKLREGKMPVAILSFIGLLGTFTFTDRRIRQQVKDTFRSISDRKYS